MYARNHEVVVVVLVLVREDDGRDTRPRRSVSRTRPTRGVEADLAALAWSTVQISKPCLLPRTKRDWRRPSRDERAVITEVCAKTHEPRLGSLRRVDGREGDRVLVVLRGWKWPENQALMQRVLADDVDELARRARRRCGSASSSR